MKSNDIIKKESCVDWATYKINRFGSVTLNSYYSFFEF